MQFNPKSPEELKKIEASSGFQLIPKGVYDAECIDAEEKRSSKGNDMLKLQWRVFVGEAQRVLTDYIVPGNDRGDLKFGTLCASVGLSDDYHSGNLDAQDLIGKCCKANIIQRKQKDGDYAGEMQNSIAGYMSAEADGPAARPAPTPSVAPKSATPGTPDDDDIPF